MLLARQHPRKLQHGLFDLKCRSPLSPSLLGSQLPYQDSKLKRENEETKMKKNPTNLWFWTPGNTRHGSAPQAPAQFNLVSFTAKLCPAQTEAPHAFLWQGLPTHSSSEHSQPVKMLLGLQSSQDALCFQLQWRKQQWFPNLHVELVSYSEITAVKWGQFFPVSFPSATSI